MYGAEAVILNLCGVLAGSLEYQSVLGVFDNSASPNLALHEAALKSGFESHLIRCRRQFDRTVPISIRNLVQQTKADVVHTHGYKPDVYAWLGLRRTSIPLVSTCHTWYDNDLALRAYGALDRWVLRSFERVVAVSDQVQDRLLRAGVAPQRVQLIRNGIDLRPFADAAENRRLRSRRGDVLRIGLVGRLAPEKGVDIFFRTAAAVLRQHPAVEFVVVGDGPDRSNLLQLLRTLQIENKASLAGQCSDMPSFYASIDILVSASRQEGLPMALLEGMASSLPVVATAVGQVSQVINNDSVGRIVPPEDSAALASAISELIGDASLRERIGNWAKARVAAEFSADKMAADYLCIYEQAIQESRS